MKDMIAALLLGAPALIPPPLAPAATAPIAQALARGGIETACAGIGLDDRNDPRWAAYNVRVEVSNPRAEYLVGAVVEVRDAKGHVLTTIAQCDAPWVLLRMAPGAYVVEARLGELTRSARVAAPKAGQQRVVLQFPET